MASATQRGHVAHHGHEAPGVGRKLAGKVIAIWGDATVRGADEHAFHPLHVDDLLKPGDVVLTSQNGIVKIEDIGVPATVIGTADQGELNLPATGAGLTGGGDGSLEDALRVGRIAEGVLPAGLLLTQPEATTRPPETPLIHANPLDLGGEPLTSGGEPPTIAVTSNTGALNTGATAVITFTLSEPSNNFNAGKIQVTGGTLGDFSGSGTSYTAVFTPDGTSPTGTITVPSNAFTNGQGQSNNDGADADNHLTLADNVPPTVSGPVAASVLENQTPPVTLNMIGTASDINGDALSVLAGSVAYTVNGVASAQPVGVTQTGNLLTIDPNNAAFDPLAVGETETITASYTISDGHGGTVIETATYTVTGINDAPVVGDPTITASSSLVLPPVFQWNGDITGFTANGGLPGDLKYGYYDPSTLTDGPYNGPATTGSMAQWSDNSGPGPNNIIQTSTSTISVVAGSSYNFAFDAEATSLFNPRVASFKWVLVDATGSVVQDLSPWYSSSAGGVAGSTVLPNAWTEHDATFIAAASGNDSIALEWVTSAATADPQIGGYGQDFAFDRIQLAPTNPVFGETVATLMAGANVTDVDHGSSLQGWAFTGAAADASGHHWQYSTDGGTTWINMDSASNTAALYLNPSDLIHWTGPAATNTTLTAVAVDNTATAAFDTTATGHLDVSATGGSTPFSASVATLGANAAPQSLDLRDLLPDASHNVAIASAPATAVQPTHAAVSADAPPATTTALLMPDSGDHQLIHALLTHSQQLAAAHA